MKKVLTLLTLVACAATALNAQYYGRRAYSEYETEPVVEYREPMSRPGDVAIDMTFNYGYKYNPYGLGLGARVMLYKGLTLAPDYAYYFKDDHWTEHHVNVNLQYRINCGHGITVYPFAGYTYIAAKQEGWSTDNLHGGNLGVGIEFRFARNVSVFNEDRIQFTGGNNDEWGKPRWDEHNQFVSNVGLRFNF